MQGRCRGFLETKQLDGFTMISAAEDGEPESSDVGQGWDFGVMGGI